MKQYLIVIFLAIGGTFSGQDIDRILISKPFSHSGSVNFSTVNNFNHNSGNPFTYVLSANYTPEIFGISLPLSAMYSNQKIAYGLPLSNWRLAPSYRWIRTQFGEANVQLSPYSLSGHRFRGVAVDVQPNEKFAVSALYGRLNDFRMADSTGEDGMLQRLCYGAKLAYNSSMYSLAGTFFKAQDVANANMNIAPQENIVVGFSGQWTLAKNIRITGEFASSALTKNTNDERVESNFRVQNLAGAFLPYRASTATFHAYKISIGSPFLNIGYEYVAPNYQTLGTHFFANDFENLTINGSHKVRSVTFGGRFGVQNDNLSNDKSSSTRRLVYALNLDYSGDSRLFGQINYSTFQTFTRVEKFLTEFENTDPYAKMDTLNFRQVEQHGDVSLGYRFRENEHSQQQIQLHVSLQTASENGHFATSSLNYSLSQKSGRSFGASAFLHHDSFENERRTSLGTTAFFGDSFSEKRGRWRVTASQTQDLNNRSAFVVRASASYIFKNKHPVQVQFSQRFSKNYSAMLTLNYGYSFGR